MEINCEGLTLEEWTKEVNKVTLKKCGVTTEDLVDYPSWDLWSDGVDPEEAAYECLVVWNDFPDDLFD